MHYIVILDLHYSCTCFALSQNTKVRVPSILLILVIDVEMYLYPQMFYKKLEILNSTVLVRSKSTDQRNILEIISNYFNR